MGTTNLQQNVGWIASSNKQTNPASNCSLRIQVEMMHEQAYTLHKRKPVRTDENFPPSLCIDSPRSFALTSSTIYVESTTPIVQPCGYHDHDMYTNVFTTTRRVVVVVVVVIVVISIAVATIIIISDSNIIKACTVISSIDISSTPASHTFIISTIISQHRHDTA